MSARAEAIGLYRSFVRLRHSFPNKKARSILRRWAGVYFRLRVAEYNRLQLTEGTALADAKAAKWRSEALQDLSMLLYAP